MDREHIFTLEAAKYELREARRAVNNSFIFSVLAVFREDVKMEYMGKTSNAFELAHDMLEKCACSLEKLSDDIDALHNEFSELERSAGDG